ncbi:MAG: hypothetical protein ACXAC5_00280 [Promethearchaeota archaeon]|jgi:ligand-binding sensor domain-containing protein
MTDIVGDGRVDGWEIVPLTFPNIRITQGTGFIDGYYVATFSDTDFELSMNGTFYVFAQRRVGITGTIGPRSDIASATYTDSAAPTTPSGFTISLGDDSSFSVDFSWIANTEIDLDHYDLERSTSVSGGFSVVATIAGTATTHTDTNGVDEDVQYFYRLYAVDQSGYRSVPAIGNITTELSPALPPNPMEVIMPASEGAINVLWKRPVTLAFEKIDSWELTWVRLATDGTEISATRQTKAVSRTLFLDRIDDLTKGEVYKVTLKTVDVKGRRSEGVTHNVVPLFSQAPKDPEGIAVTETELVPDFLIMDFSWTDGADEYDPLIPYRYNIYVTVDGEQESLAIHVPIRDTDQVVELYTFDLINHFPIPQDKLITFRFTSLTQNGIESAGNYLRFVTAKFGQPLPVGNLLSEFDAEAGKITVTWDNQNDAADITVKVVDDDLGDEHPAAEIINRSIGLIEQFVFDAELNHIYTITVTSFDSNGVAGPSDVTVEITLLSGGFPPPELPREIFPKAGDRQVTFSWTPSPNISVASYNIYRKTGVISITATDWTLLDNVPKRIDEFTDFGLENDQIYAYYITAVDLYGQESRHLPDAAINLNFFEVIPKASGILTEPSNVQLSLTGNDILITWESLLEEFDAFTVYRSINNLHIWEAVVDVDRNVNSYLDEDLPLVDGTTFYYAIGKTIDDSDIVVQVSNVAPENSILLGTITSNDTSFSAPDVTDRRNIKDLVDPLTEYTTTYVLTHRHREVERFDPTRIDLNPELVITNWETVDGRIFTTEETDISGTGHIVKIDGRFPTVLFEVDVATGRLIFTEAIVDVDEFGVVVGELPNIEMRVLGIEEVQGTLDASRFDEIHARQVAFGRLSKEQMPFINHEGRIRERMLPKTYLLERFSNHTFVVPQGNTDNTKTFGDGMTFYSVIESDGLIKEVIDWDQEDDGTIVGFRNPSFSTDTISNLRQHEVFIPPTTSVDSAQEHIFDGDFFAANNYPDPEPTHTLNKITLSVNNLGANHGVNLEDAAIDPGGQRLYYITSRWTLPPKLFIIDLVIGVAIGEQEISYPTSFEFSDNTVTTFAFNINRNAFYIINEDNRLIKVNTADFTGDFVHPTNTLGGLTTYQGMAYDQVNDIMYAVSAGGVDEDKLWTIDLDSGTASEVGYDIDYPLGDIASLTFDYANNKLYAVEDAAGGSNLWEIDPDTGIGTEVGFYSTPNGGPTDGIEAPPFDNSFWKVGPDFLVLGNTPGLQNDIYLRYQLDLDVGATIGTAELNFAAHHNIASSGDVNLRVSILDPALYADSVTLATEAIKTVGTLVSTDWSPYAWDLQEDGPDTSLDIRSMLQTFIDDSAYSKGRHVIFKVETLGISDFGARRVAAKEPKLKITYVLDLAEVTSDVSFQSEKSYHFQFDFADFSPTRWLRITSFNAPVKPNPIIDLKKRLRFKLSLESGSFFLALGVRELTIESAETGDNGGIAGPIEWVGATETVTDEDGNTAPRGKLIRAGPGWQEIEFDLERENVISFSDDANGILEGSFGVLEHLAFTLDPDGPSPTGPFDVYIDRMQQVDDVLVAGTSQGLQISRDFGTSWKFTRFVDTPIHKFYRAQNNPFIWAVAANTVLISVDPANWFETSGLTGVQYVRDIAEDIFGNMFVSTEKGVFWFETALINNFSSWRQTQPVTPFTTDCYGMYHNSISSGVDEIWVSTEVGIFKTTDLGQTWIDTDMNTQGLPAFEFINIGTSSALPNIISITRKHVLRKLGAETDFSVLANLEVQHEIADIWTMEYFAGHIYISTGKGVYWNSMDELFVPSINTALEHVLPGLAINGQLATAFGLDAVVVQTELGSVTQLFIGQENRIMMADELNVLSIKEQFPNKEIPSFFADDTELTIGYIYNAFNNVLSFRIPQPVNILYSASHLPRKIYIPINKGWAQTNPSTDVFLFVNGIPKWLDFKLDEAAILSELQILQGKLAPMTRTLTSFNSLYPDSSDQLSIVLADIRNIIEGGDDGAAIVNNTTIIQFLEDYTRFLSLITTTIVNNNDLDVFPRFNVAGFPATQRQAGSRAATLEEKENFTANNSTGINIDTFTGEVDFLTVFTTTTDQTAAQEFVFDKYDRLDATIFKANITTTGEFTHRELEDQMEAVNTGLSSHLARAHYTNLIKTGIFLETNHNYLFDRFNTSSIQSQYNSAHTNTWYDVTNSTIDYGSIIEVSNTAESRLVNTVTLFIENPYLADRVWVGTDNDIAQYELNNVTGELTLEDSVRPGNGISPLFIWNVFVLNEDDIYVVAEEKDAQVGHIFRTQDGGSTWSDLDTINLPQKIYTFAILSGNKIAGTENGLFYCDNSFGTWYSATLTLSPQLSETSPSVAAFSERIRNLEATTFLVAESDRWFYTSAGGIDWFALARQATSNNMTVISKILRFKNLTWIATDKGLYNDGNSVLSDGVQFGLQTELEDSSSESANINISDITAGEDALYCSAENKIYRFLDNEWKNYEVPDVTAIHKIAIRESLGKAYLIVVSHNLITMVDTTPSTGVFN